MENHQYAIHTPLAGDNDILLPPSMASGFNTPRDSYTPSSSFSPGTPPLTFSAPLLTSTEHSATYDEKRTPPASRNRKPLLLIAVLAAVVVFALAVVLPVYFVVVRPKSHHSNNSIAVQTPPPASTSGLAGSPVSAAQATSGGDGSLVTAADGSTFTYKNPYGGYWVSDLNDPYNNGARPQSWVPALNESWKFGTDKIHGVNLGGWFVLEPFIVPRLFEKYQNISIPAVDEWTLSQAMRADTSPGGGINQLELHYQTFITEKDFADISGAGLNWIRLPIPFWAIDKWNDEPFLDKVSWKYILQAFAWARKYGLRVCLDLHTIPGSQNGYNHSGKSGQVNFLNGVMGLANAERALGYIRVITEFISQPQYRDVVPIFGIVNEALLRTIGKETLTSFYLRAHDMIRDITRIGQGPYIAIHDGFFSVESWANFLPGSDRIILDTHPYFAFSGEPNTQPLSDFVPLPCNAWGSSINNSQRAFGVTIAGEFSNAVNDCGLWVRGVGGQPAYGGNCNDWDDISIWDQAKKDGLMQFALSSMDALQNYFFWTWKIGNSSVTNSVRAPLWSYQLGLQNGFIPKDPRKAYGICKSLGVTPDNPFDGTFSSWQTGGAGASNIPQSLTAQFPFPPFSIAGVDQVSLLPTYTNTGAVETLTMPSFTLTASSQASTFSVGDGWFNKQDTTGGVTPVAGCTYPDAWDAVNAALPTVACTGPAKKREVLEPRITPPPH